MQIKILRLIQKKEFVKAKRFYLGIFRKKFCLNIVLRGKKIL